MQEKEDAKQTSQVQNLNKELEGIVPGQAQDQKNEQVLAQEQQWEMQDREFADMLERELDREIERQKQLETEQWREEEEMESMEEKKRTETKRECRESRSKAWNRTGTRGCSRA